jgi:5-formyltetrahydrofolate cyclo-ligase
VFSSPKRTASAAGYGRRSRTPAPPAFPAPGGRIPNFKGAEAAASRVQTLDTWRGARVIKCNPDSPQLPLRRAALGEGKTVYMAVPRLRQEECFLELDPAVLGRNISKAATIKGAFEHGRPVRPEDVRPIGLIVAGSVAVAADGSRAGKGGGYSDLEFAVLTEFGKIRPDVPVITTVHELQVVDEPPPMHPHDISLDLIVTPERVIECSRPYRRPEGVYWDLISRERIEEIPAVKRLWQSAARTGKSAH